jgi:sec-independent protein translocase protein TatB
MFDIDAGKLLILGVIALVVLGPKELPRVMRQVGSAIGKMRSMAAEFQAQFMDAMKQSELEEMKKDMQKMADQAKVDINYDPVSETDRQIRQAIDGKPAEHPNLPTPTPTDPDPDVRPAAVPAPAPAEPAPAVAAAPQPASLETQPRKAGEA